MATLDASLEFALGGGGQTQMPPEAYARMMQALLPPGKAWRLIGESALATLLVACADELARFDELTFDLRNEAIPTTAVALLPEYERQLGLESTGNEEERRARVLAHLLARQRYRPVDFRTTLAPLLGMAAEDVVVIERSRADAVAMDDDREIFRFFVYRDPAEPGAYYLDSAQALVDRIKPSHTVGHVIESIDFVCDSPTDLCDRDILGV